MSVTPTWQGARRHYGPGKLFVAPLGTVTSAYAPVSTGAGIFALGTSATTVPGSTAWLPLGYTEKGSKLTTKVKTEQDEAAESYYPLATPVVGTEASWDVSLKTANLTNLRIAFNAPTSAVSNVSGAGGVVPDASTVVRLNPPLAGSEVRVQLLFISTEQNMVIVAYKALNIGNLDLSFEKGASGLTLPLQFNLELPDVSVAGRPFDILATGTSFDESVSGE